MITWKFENSPITFKSTEANLNRDISKMAYANQIDPSTKITIIDGTPNNPLPANAPGGDGDTSTIPQPTVSVGAKKTKTSKHKTDELPAVSGNVDDATPSSDILDPSGDDGNSCWSGDWFDNQRV